MAKVSCLLWCLVLIAIMRQADFSKDGSNPSALTGKCLILRGGIGDAQPNRENLLAPAEYEKLRPHYAVPPPAVRGPHQTTPPPAVRAPTPPSSDYQHHVPQIRIGSHISLISKSDLRYDGRLHSVDQDKGSLMLSEVQCFGDEGRRGHDYVPPNDKLYEHIIFRGTDIKDLHVLAPPPQYDHLAHSRSVQGAAVRHVQAAVGQRPQEPTQVKPRAREQVATHGEARSTPLQRQATQGRETWPSYSNQHQQLRH